MMDSNSVPPIQLEKHIATGANTDARSAPYWVRGRDHETAHIISTLSKMPCAISVIAGSPGSGKSTLLTHIKAYANYLGWDTVELSNEDFANETALTDALLKVEDLATATPDQQNQSRASGINVDAKLIQAEFGKSRTGTANNQRPLTWRLALNELGKGDGTVILMDEMQRLDELHENPDEAKLVRNFMNELHSKHMRRPERKIALLGCGLSHTREVLNSFKMTRVENNHVIRLGPLSSDASRQILMDHCSARTKQDQTLPQPPAGLIDELAEVSGGCAHHLAWAGCRLQQQAIRVRRRSDQATWEEGDIAWVARESELDRVGLYINRMPDPDSDISDNEPAQALAFTLATAVESYGRALPASLVLRLNKCFAAEAAAEINPLKTLIEKGVIERRENGHRFLTVDQAQPHETHYAFPIHSMGRWLREVKQNEVGTGWGRKDSESVLDRAQEAGQELTVIPEWQWDYQQDIDVIPDDELLPPAGVDATNREVPEAVPEPREGLLQAIHGWFQRRLNRDERRKQLTAEGAPAQLPPPSESTSPTALDVAPDRAATDD